MRAGQAHPRSRGENAGVPEYVVQRDGSSPLTRGKLWPVPEGSTPAGLIPAHAGKTRSSPWSPSPSTAHPRSRGENASTADRRSHIDGSSPLTRGKLGLSPEAGEDLGSSPLTRGKRATRPSYSHGARLIPAHAGKTERVCAAQAGGGGSSPLTRGKHELAVGHARCWGLIPAHAGKTLTHTAGGGRGRAHPRSRGENHRLRQSVLLEAGSSPLTRGKPSGGTKVPRTTGLIPAHAGKTA